MKKENKEAKKNNITESFSDALSRLGIKPENEEEHFLNLYKSAQSNNARLKVVATFKNGKGSVKLKAIDSNHPFYNLDGKDNIVLFYTNRYKEQPMVIKGAGAGADVTASGIFADVLRIAQSDL